MSSGWIDRIDFVGHEARPYCRISNVVDAAIAKRETASNYLKALARIGVLQERRSGREKLFVQPKLLTRLTTEGNEFEPYSRE